MAEIFCWSLSARSGTSAATREMASLVENSGTLHKTLHTWLEKLAPKSAEASIFYLGSCHRIELYAYGMDPFELLRTWQEHKSHIFEAHLKIGVEAFAHLARVGAGLESEVLGETQIMGQLKDAAENSRKDGLLKGLLDRSLQHALHISKKLRKEANLGAGTVSVAHVAIDGLDDFFESLEDQKILLVGAGSMATQSLERILAKGGREITWINRSPEKILHHPLVDKCVVASFGQLGRLIWEHSVSVFATSAPEPLIYLERLKDYRSEAHVVAGPRVLLDLGLPRNVDPELHDQDQFYVRNVDEFSNRAQVGAEFRRLAALDAEKILAAETAAFPAHYRKWLRGPQIRELVDALEAFRVAELSRVAPALAADFDNASRAFNARILHALLMELEAHESRQESYEFDTAKLLEFLVQAWRPKWQEPKNLDPNLESNPVQKVGPSPHP